MKRRIPVALLLLAFALPSLSAGETPEKPVDQKTLHAIGYSVFKSLSIFTLTSEELEQVLTGLKNAHAGKQADFDSVVYRQKIQDLAKTRRKALGDKLAVEGRVYLEKVAREKGAVKTSSGMVYVPLTVGNGESPAVLDMVKVNYRGKLIDGTEFDSSFSRGKPLEFKLNGVIKCWTEGLQKMKSGGKAKLICPPELAYGENGAGEKILPGATLDFEVELLEVKKTGATPKPVGPVIPSTPSATDKVKEK